MVNGKKLSKEPFRFVIPKGRLFETIRSYLAVLGIVLRDPDRRGFCGPEREGEGPIEFWARKPGAIPALIAREHATYRILPLESSEDEEVLTCKRVFHAGLTGEDMLIETACEQLRKVAVFSFSSRIFRPTKWVLSQLSHDAPQRVQRFVEQDTGRLLVIGCEWLNLARELMAKKGQLLATGDYRFIQLDGTEEAAIQDGLCHAVICPVETGESLEVNDLGKGIMLMVSHPCIVARTGLCEEHESVLEGLSLGLEAVDGASQKVMVAFDLPKGSLKNMDFPLLGVSPTHAPLVDKEWEAVEICIPRADLMTVLPAVKRAGARAIVVRDIQAFLG